MQRREWAFEVGGRKALKTECQSEDSGFIILSIT